MTHLNIKSILVIKHLKFLILLLILTLFPITTIKCQDSVYISKNDAINGIYWYEYALYLDTKITDLNYRDSLYSIYSHSLNNTIVLLQNKASELRFLIKLNKEASQAQIQNTLQLVKSLEKTIRKLKFKILFRDILIVSELVVILILVL